MKSRQDVERRLRELRKESAELERKGLPFGEHMVMISTLNWVMQD